MCAIISELPSITSTMVLIVNTGYSLLELLTDLNNECLLNIQISTFIPQYFFSEVNNKQGMQIGVSIKLLTKII